MKKLRTILIAILACAIVFSLAACGDEGGAVNPADIKGEEVTAEQWESAFAMTGVTSMTVKYIETYKGGDGEYIGTSVYKYDGDKVHKSFQSVENSEEGKEERSRERYEVKEGDKYYRYNYDEESKKWSREEMWVPEGYWGVQDFATEIDDFVDLYEEFTYDNAKNAYVLSDDGDNYLVKITGGKLAYIESEFKYTEDGYETVETASMQFYDYGKTSVTLPSISGDEPENPSQGGALTQAEWNAAFAESAFVNVIMEIGVEGDDPFQTMMFDLNNDRFLVHSTMGGESISILTIEDDTYYMYSVTEQNVFRMQVTQDMYDGMITNMLMTFTQIKDFYDSFTFNAETGLYTADEITIGNERMTDVSVKFENGKLVSFKASSSEEEEGTIIMVMTLSAYGTTEITVPTDYEDIQM